MTCPRHERRFDLETGAALRGGEHAVSHRIVVNGDDVLVELAPGPCAAGSEVGVPASLPP